MSISTILNIARSGLEASQVAIQTTSHNISNVDTPGYSTKDIDFQFEFMSLTQGASPNVIDAPGLVVNNDGNNVSMDREARLLAENALRFNLASSLMKTQLKLINSAIQEGKSG